MILLERLREDPLRPSSTSKVGKVHHGPQARVERGATETWGKDAPCLGASAPQRAVRHGVTLFCICEFFVLPVSLDVSREGHLGHLFTVAICFPYLATTTMTANAAMAIATILGSIAPSGMKRDAT